MKRIESVSAESNALQAQRVSEFALRVWGNAEDARRWLNRPHMELGGKTPNSLLNSNEGIEAVEALLAALEFGFPV